MPYADSSGVKIRWEETGVGEPILLIMGLGYTLEMWHRLVPVLSERYRVLAFDNRGVGESDVPPGPYQLPDMAEDAAAVLAAAGETSAHVLGVSMGSVIAQELALRYPEQVRSLILGCSMCGGPKSVAAEPEVIEMLGARAHMGPEAGARAMIPYIYDPATPQALIDEDLAIRLRTFPTAEGYLGQLGAVFGYETFDRLPLMSVPTLVIHGESDRLVPPANGIDVAERIPGAKLVMLPQASHIFFTDQPEESNRSISQFLRQMSS